MRITPTGARLMFFTAATVVVLTVRTTIVRRNDMSAELLACITRNDESCVERLVNSGVPLDGPGMAGARTARQRARAIMAALHVHYDMPISPPLAYSLEYFGVTTTYPYRLVYLPENIAITRSLLIGGASANSTTCDGESALVAAIMSGKYRTAVCLVEYGADPNAVCQANGFSALMWAASLNQVDLVKILISKGAKVNYATPRDETALNVTAQGRRGAIVRECLLAAGARK